MKPWTIAGLIIGVLLLLVFLSTVRRQVAPPVANQSFSTNTTERRVTLSEITNGTVTFFDRRGNALWGYVEKSQDQIELYPVPTGTTPQGATISPMTEEKVQRYTAILTRRAEEEKKIAVAREAQAQQDALIKAVEEKRLAEEKKRTDESNAVVQAKADLEQYREHHLALRSSFDRAVLIVNENNTQNMTLSSLIADSFTKGGATTTPALFKPAFVQEGLFEKIFAGQTDAAKRLAFTNVSHAVLFGRQSVSYSTNPNLKDVVTATMSLELSAASAVDLQPISAQTLRSIGAGFNRDEARQLAEERMVSQLTNGVLQDLDKSLSNK